MKQTSSDHFCEISGAKPAIWYCTWPRRISEDNLLVVSVSTNFEDFQRWNRAGNLNVS